ncbi:Acyl-protein thioesterase 2 [Folsomia candida]|uniref:palmitoyl-protein hydrolase n=1 Tax=Folsomia candida TaxID=158441 RepID=A0A226D2M2_FOLCA|nr:Acyl-protein thioesterase 2 [Folsomia candida]
MFALQLLRPIVLPSVVKQTSTIIFLHGLGDTGQSWADILPMVRPSHTKIICPNAPVQAVTLNQGVVMPAWFDLRPLDQPKDEFGIKCAAEAIQEVIAVEIASAVALYTGLTLPFRLAGILALSTWLPLDKSIPLEKAQTPPILICHGDEDNMIALPRAEKTAQVLSTVNKNVEFKVYPGLGHTVACEEELQDISKWLEKVSSSNNQSDSNGLKSKL